MPTLTIDGRTVEVREGTYVLEAARKPADFWWAPPLVLLFLGFIGFNSVLLGRYFVRD